MNKFVIAAAVAAGTAVVATIAYNTGLVVQHSRDAVAIKAAANDILETLLKNKSNAN